MKLPKCPRRSTVNGIWSTLTGKLKSESSGHTKSNGGGDDLPHAAMALDRAPKSVSPSTADQWQNDVPNGSGWSEMEEGVVGNKTEVVAWSNSGKINGGSDGFWPRFFKP